MRLSSERKLDPGSLTGTRRRSYQLSRGRRASDLLGDGIKEPTRLRATAEAVVVREWSGSHAAPILEHAFANYGSQAIHVPWRHDIGAGALE